MGCALWSMGEFHYFFNLMDSLWLHALYCLASFTLKTQSTTMMDENTHKTHLSAVNQR